ncbi:MAG: hypothetical protein KJ574_00350 [Nanoarchaeota archaeon]|nr:hypothetical protein [Nanoarchaeota archaeon]
MAADMITAREIYDFFVSEQFIRAMREAGDHTFDTGYESAFSVYRCPDKTYKIPHITKCRFQSNEVHHLMEDGGDTDPDPIEDPEYDFLHFHFHPSPDEPEFPGESDLLGFSDPILRPLMGVGQIKDDKSIDVLLVQNRFEMGRESLTDVAATLRLEDGAENFTTTEDAVRFFRDLGLYNAQVIGYRYMKKRDVYIPRFRTEDLAQFAHSVDKAAHIAYLGRMADRALASMRR